MVNQINGPIPPASGSAGKKTSPTEAGGTENQSSAPEQSQLSGDRIELSAQAQLLGRLEAQINAVPDIDQERVARLKTEIENGRYEIDDSSLAQRIIDLELE